MKDKIQFNFFEIMMSSALVFLVVLNHVIVQKFNCVVADKILILFYDLDLILMFIIFLLFAVSVKHSKVIIEQVKIPLKPKIEKNKHQFKVVVE